MRLDNSKDMDYFELLGIEKRYDVDLREMEKLFWKVGCGCGCAGDKSESESICVS